MGPRRGCDRIQPWHETALVIDEFLRREFRAGKFRQQVDELAVVQECRQRILRLWRQQAP